MQVEMLEANFINIIARPTLEENIRKCVAAAGLDVQEVLISPLCLANALLAANEKRSGCALVDMGADTTTVSVYVNNILRHLCVIPLGGSNVTSDITSLKVEAEEAEELKKKYGTAYRSDTEDKTGEKVNLSFDRTEDVEKLQEIVEARYEEIIANVNSRISAYKDKMLSGIVVTGGAARIPDLQKAFSRQTGGDINVRIVKGLPENVSVSFGVQVGDPDRLNTLYALLLAGKENCVGELSEDPVQKTFDFEKKEEPDPEPEPGPEPPTPQDPQPKKPSAFGRIWKTFEKMLTDEAEAEDEKE
jgi:cell division protein FtsA